MPVVGWVTRVSAAAGSPSIRVRSPRMGSASTSTTLAPARVAAAARFTATVVAPSPALAPVTSTRRGRAAARPDAASTSSRATASSSSVTATIVSMGVAAGTTRSNHGAGAAGPDPSKATGSAGSAGSADPEVRVVGSAALARASDGPSPAGWGRSGASGGSGTRLRRGPDGWAGSTAIGGPSGRTSATGTGSGSPADRGAVDGGAVDGGAGAGRASATDTTRTSGNIERRTGSWSSDSIEPDGPSSTTAGWPGVSSSVAPRTVTMSLTMTCSNAFMASTRHSRSGSTTSTSNGTVSGVRLTTWMAPNRRARASCSNVSMRARSTSRLDAQKAVERTSMPKRSASPAASASPVDESRSS